MAYIYRTSDSTPRYYPACVFVSEFYVGEDYSGRRMVMRRNNMESDWGEASAAVVLGGTDDKESEMPGHLSMTWLSAAEAKCYTLEKHIDSEAIAKLWEETDDEGYNLFKFIVVGMAPYGGVALWLRGEKKSVLVDWTKAEETDPYSEETAEFFAKCTPEQFSALALARDETVLQYLQEHGLPPTDQYDRWMKQYKSRYVVLEEYWDGEAWKKYKKSDLYYDDMDIRYIEEERYDGTHCRMYDTSLMRYHKAGIPKRTVVSWKEGAFEFQTFFWFNHEAMEKVLDRFFALAPKAKANILMRMDTRNQHYELALKGGALEEPVALPQEAYEMLVFRGSDEFWRSPNFSQEDEKAWEW